RSRTTELLIPPEALSPVPEETTTTRRPRRGDVVLPREIFSLMLAGDLHAGHAAVAATIVSIIAEGRAPIPPATGAAVAVSYDPGTQTITVDRQAGSLLYDCEDLSQFAGWLRWCRTLAAHDLVEVEEPMGRLVRIRPTRRLLEGTRRPR